MRSLYGLGALAAGIAAMCVSGMARAEPPEKISLSILYMGQPESARANDFAQVPSGAFHQGRGDGRREVHPRADGVVQRRHPRFRLPAQDEAEAAADYSKPTVLQGMSGARVGSSLGLRLGFS